MSSKNGLTVLFYPSFDNDEEFTDHYYRMLWYLNPLRDRIRRIVIPYEVEAPSLGDLPYYLDPAIKQMESPIANAVDLANCRKAGVLEAAAQESEIVLVWRVDTEQRDKVPAGPLKPVLMKKKRYLVDHKRVRYAGSFYLRLSAEICTSDATVQECSDKFRQIPAHTFSKTGYIYGTGPSLSSAMNTDLSDGTSIICNTIVKNKDLMRKLKPPLIAFADPIFHAGCSTYAGDFRRHVHEAVAEFDSYLVVPMRDYAVYMANMDPSLRERIIGVPIVPPNIAPGQLPNLNLYRKFQVTPAAGILLLFLIPLAATFFDRTFILGCDGRPLDQNDYFWRHDPASQLVERMEDIQAAHPAFFAIDYNDFYLEYCEVVARWLDEAERQGKSFFSLTPSYIPALKCREATATCLVGPFDRDAHAHIDEGALIAALPATQADTGVMLDVGAMHGAALSRFVRRGWQVFAFEPDPSNRKELDTKLGDNPNLTIDCRAVADRVAEGLIFYSSAESPGISSLHPFHESHKETCTVSTTTIADFVREKGLQHIDYLKIDAEGYDFPVLRGVPWDIVKPKVVMCEFEDRRSTPLGYTMQDMARYLTGHGYTVLVSEWHPVTRYGGKQDWHRLVAYPCELNDANAWGNLIAFRDGPAPEEIAAAARPNVKLGAAVTNGQSTACAGAPRGLTAQAGLREEPAQSVGTPAVSIIMPAFNAAKPIGNSIGSIQTQSLTNWELLVIDDGSTDDTREVVQRLAGSDSRIRLLECKGKGVSDARNTGLDAARGEFITFLDADDFMYADALKRRVEALRKNPRWNLVHCTTELVAADSRKLGWQVGRRSEVSFRDMNGNPCHINSLMGRSQVFKSVRFETGLTNGEDWLFLSDVLRSGEVSHRVDGCSAAYVVRKDSAVCSDYLSHENKVLEVLDMIYGPVRDNLPAAQEYAQGLTWPPKEQVALRRRVGLLTWLLLEQRGDDVLVVLREFGPQALAVLSRDDIRNQITYPAMRYYVCSQDELPERLSKDRKRITALISQAGIERTFPQYAEEFRSVLRRGTTSRIRGLRKRSLYRRLVNYLKRDHPNIVMIGRFAKWSLARLKRNSFGIWGIAMLVILGLYAAGALIGPLRWYLVGSATALLLLAGGLLGLLYVRSWLKRSVTNQRRSVQAATDMISRDHRARAAQFQSALEGLKREIAHTRETSDGLQATVSRSEAMLAELKAGISDSSDRVDRLTTEVSETKDTSAGLAKTVSASEAAVAEVKKEVSASKDTSDGLKKIVSASEATLAELKKDASDNRETLGKLTKEVSDSRAILGKMNVGNFALFQQFNRRLTNEDLKRFAEEWAPKLGLNLNARALAYIAHRICLTEDTCIGRLGGNIETMLLRIMIARGVKEPTLEVLEIGTLFGVGVAMIHETCQGLFDGIHITIVDPLNGYYGSNLDILTRMPITRDIFVHNMQRMNIPETDYTIIQKLSMEDGAVEQASERRYNLLIIDGDHTGFGVKHDFLSYRHLVKRGGYIIFDDYGNPQWPELKDFVDKEVAGMPELECVGTDVYSAVFRVVTTPDLMRQSGYAGRNLQHQG